MDWLSFGRPIASARDAPAGALVIFRANANNVLGLRTQFLAGHGGGEVEPAVVRLENGPAQFEVLSGGAVLAEGLVVPTARVVVQPDVAMCLLGVQHRPPVGSLVLIGDELLLRFGSDREHHYANVRSGAYLTALPTGPQAMFFRWHVVVQSPEVPGAAVGPEHLALTTVTVADPSRSQND